METDAWNKKNTVSIMGAARRIGIKADVLQYYIKHGELESRDGRITITDCDKIKKQKEQYIGIKAFCQTHNSVQFDGRFIKNREKYIDYLAVNADFGAKRYYDSEIHLLFALPGAEEFYFSVADIDRINLHSKEFFENFGLSEQEKIEKIIKNTKEHDVALQYLTKFLSNADASAYTPSLTEFVKEILSEPDIPDITDDDISRMINECKTKLTRQYIVAFYNYVIEERKVKVKYTKHMPESYERKETEAYPHETYLAIAKFVWAPRNLHNLINKALNSHLDAEMWLFLTTLFLCAWNGKQICDSWTYFGLRDNNNPFSLNLETLKEDILNDGIDKDIYESIAMFASTKNGIPITPRARAFYGRLLLISEYHYLASGEGKMKSNRINSYKNRIRIREFFGEEVYDILGNHNISTSRLNKNYEQGIEKTAIENGYPSYKAYQIASMAKKRCHLICSYYKAVHGTGEPACHII